MHKRKNWLFCWTEVGAKHAGIVQSLIAKCRLQGIDPYTYLIDVLQRVGQHPAARVEELTPRRWKALFADSPLRSERQTMAMHNADNQRIKRRCFVFLKEAKRQSEDSVDAVAKALARFEAYTRYRDFKLSGVEQAVICKKRLADQDRLTSGGKLRKATLAVIAAKLSLLSEQLDCLK